MTHRSRPLSARIRQLHHLLLQLDDALLLVALLLFELRRRLLQPLVLRSDIIQTLLHVPTRLAEILFDEHRSREFIHLGVVLQNFQLLRV